MIQYSHDDYVKMIHNIAHELGLKVLKSKQYVFYKPDLTVGYIQIGRSMTELAPN